MSTDINDVLVVGAGFAGLSAAISIGKLGKNVTVVERSTSLADGAAITLSNRAPDVLAELDVLDAAVEEGLAFYDHTVYDRGIYNSAGNEIPVRGLPKRGADGLPIYLIMYRPTLARILVERAAAAGITVRHGVTVRSVENLGDRAQVDFDDGTTADYDLVVAADGTNSRIRERLFPGRVTPHYSGHMSLRWVKRGVPDGVDGTFIDPTGRAVFVRRVKGDMVYVAAGVDMEDRPVGHEEGVRLFREALSGFTVAPVQRLLATVHDDDEVIARPYTTHNLPAPWHSGRILLIGDAMHTMSAHLGAGGVMALEDGVVLGQEIAAGGEVDELLTRFARRRARRTWVAVDACRQMLDLQVNYQAEPADIHRIREIAFTELIKPY